jgi:hypothetical protein
MTGAELTGMINMLKTLTDFISELKNEFDSGKEKIVLTKDGVQKYLEIAETYHDKRVRAGLIDE